MKIIANRIVSKLTPNSLPIFIMIVMEFMLLISSVIVFRLDDQHYVHLANSFLHGRLDFIEVPSQYLGWDDTSLYNGRHYWPLGVFPALILLPFVFVFGNGSVQVYISTLLTFLNLLLLYKISLKTSKRVEASIVLAFAYIFSSAYAAVAYFSISWWFAHVVATSCILLSIYFTYVKSRPLLSGTFFAFGFLSRISLIFGILFFPLYYYFFHREKFIKMLFNFFVPVLLGILISFSYNYLRFGGIFKTGYEYQLTIPEIIANRNVAMWSIKHIPTNLYLFLLKGPGVVYKSGTLVLTDIIPDRWGMSFLITSPIFLLILAANFRKSLNKIAGVSALAIALFIFGSFGTGAYQYGYRFALDFQPFLYLILADHFRERDIGLFTIFLVSLSLIFNYIMVVRFIAQF
jgi:hypothetical protein